MLLSSLFFSLMSAMVRGLSEVNSYTTVAMRFIVGGLVAGALFSSGIQKLRWINWPWIVLRGVSGGIACILFYWGIQHVGLSKGVLLGYTYVIFASIFSVFILREQIKLPHWIAIATALVGAGLICGVTNLSMGSGEMVALLGGVIAGFAVVCVTKCRENDSSTNIFFSQCIFGLVIVFWPVTSHWAMPTTGQWHTLVLIGVLAAGGQLSMTYAYKYTGATQGSLLGLLTPILGTLIGVAYFREALGIGFLLGASLVLASCCYLSLNPVGRPTPNPGVGAMAACVELTAQTGK
ncbi:MAG: DMT family transporter [Armatimonadetes bacterium]|nr:DMT family transporter [Armatimonadota bacterium]